MTSTPASGGFTADLAEAFNPPSAGGCCGSAPATTPAGPPASAPVAVSPCCGTATEAEESGGCCGATAKADAVAAGQGCCG